MYKSLFTLSAIGFASSMNGATDQCAPTPPATCYPADCTPCYCLGPDNYSGNPPVCPKTCNGDFIITVAGFYWNAHQDGMEYAIDNRVVNPNALTPLTNANILELNNLIDSRFKTPDFEWDFGFKVGLGYCTTCDGWDIGVTWTWYRGKANDHIEAELDDNHTLLPLWSMFAPSQGLILYATDIESHWKLELNLVDIELGRNFWTSRYLSIRPHIGLRIAYLNQDFDLQHKGGSWGENTDTSNPQDNFNNEVDMENDFKGVGIRGGLDSTWNLGCGWAIYGNFAASIVYGRFSLDYDEENRLATSPHSKTKIAEWHNDFRASRGMLDLAIGVQWSTMFCNCSYGFTGMIGWENHLFFDQNQLWANMRIGDTSSGAGGLPNNTGENVYIERRGTLDTQGWTLRIIFEF